MNRHIIAYLTEHRFAERIATAIPQLPVLSEDGSAASGSKTGVAVDSTEVDKDLTCKI